MSRRAGLSILGLLISLVCMVVLFAIGMTALNKAVTGQGSVVQGTVRSVQDEMTLYGLMQGLAVQAMDFGGRFPIPSDLTQHAEDDVTASFFSTLVMQQYAATEALVSANEYSGYVDIDDDYDFRMYQPRDGVYWDPAFRADLADLSNTSFAHMPFFGERLARQWRSDGDASFPLLGNRGPRDGIDDPSSLTYGRNGQWAGHVVFGDGHVAFIDTFTPANVFFERDGERHADNIFAVEDEPGGGDAILSFTRVMTANGPVLQFD